MALTGSDKERIKDAMKAVKDIQARREGSPVRDEAKIAAILRDAEAKAEAEHQRLLDSQPLYNGIVKPQTAVSHSRNLRPFPEIAAMKKRFNGPDGNE